MSALQLATGTLVRVRQRNFLVEEVCAAPGRATVVSLACVDDDAQGQRIDLIWDAEVDARVVPAGASAVRPNPTPDDPRTFAAYLHALRWGCVTSTDSTLFQAPLRAGIVPKSYQLEPGDVLVAERTLEPPHRRRDHARDHDAERHLRRSRRQHQTRVAGRYGRVGGAGGWAGPWHAGEAAACSRGGLTRS